MAIRAYRCPECQIITELTQSLHAPSQATCGFCGGAMVRYFGQLRECDVHCNFGFRPDRYATEEDARIAAFQFANL